MLVILDDQVLKLFDVIYSFCFSKRMLDKTLIKTNSRRLDIIFILNFSNLNT